MVIQIVARELLKAGARYVYRGLRAQDRLIDYTYRKTGLYNRGRVAGIKHGLAGGQIIGGTFKLGLPGYDEDAPLPKRSPPGNQYKERGRPKRYSGSGYRYNSAKSRYNKRYCYPRRRKFGRTR